MHQCNDPRCDICNAKAAQAVEEVKEAAKPAFKKTFPNRAARRRNMKVRGEFRKP